ncbi:MAG: hypothetical protein AABW80_03600 [Nanoarchaeota archaeon]
MKKTLAYLTATGLALAVADTQAMNIRKTSKENTPVKAKAFYNPHGARGVDSAMDNMPSFVDSPYFVRRDNAGNVTERYFVERDHWGGTNDLGIVIRKASETTIRTDNRDSTAHLGDVLYAPILAKQGTNLVTGLKWSATGPNSLKIVRTYLDNVNNGSGVRVEFSRPVVKYTIDPDGPARKGESDLPARTWLAPESTFGGDLPFAFVEDSNRVFGADGSFGVKPGKVYGWKKLTDSEADEILKRIQEAEKKQADKERKAVARKKKNAEKMSKPIVGDVTSPFLD